MNGFLVRCNLGLNKHYLHFLKKIKHIHQFSLIMGIIVISYGIIMSVIKDSFHDYFQLVFIGAVLAGLGLLNKNKG